MKYNKGEWSEFYVLLKLLADGELAPADENLQKLKDLVYPVIKVINKYREDIHEYVINGSTVDISSSSFSTSIPVVEFEVFARNLLTGINEGKGSSFEVRGVEELLEKINCSSIKASSLDKADIQVVVHDAKTGQTPQLGFSIKSQIGSPSTLFNAGKTTNFVYKVEGVDLSDSDIEKINSITNKQGNVDVRGRVSELYSRGASLVFNHNESSCFENNLCLIDSQLPIILGEMLLKHYRSLGSNILDVLDVINRENILGFDVEAGHPYYEYKVKKFLTDVALGMVPSKVWNGHNDANGGYIIIRQDGEVVCYHLYDRNLFENYLITNTKFDTPSTKRYEFGEVFKGEDGALYFKLCMQIRFKK